MEAAATTRSSRPEALVLALCALAAVVSAACVSTPRPAGPTTLGGRAPAARVGETAPALERIGHSDGPLLLENAQLTWLHVSATGGAFRWESRLVNPTSTLFDVTVVVELRDRDGRMLTSTSAAYVLGGGDQRSIFGEGMLDPEALERVATWRIEYWIEMPRQASDPGGQMAPLAGRGIAPSGAGATTRWLAMATSGSSDRRR